MKKNNKKYTIGIIVVLSLFFVAILLCVIFAQPLTYLYVISVLSSDKTINEKSFNELSDNLKRNYFNECIKIQKESDDKTRLKMLCYLEDLSDAYPEARDIAAINCQGASVPVKADCLKILIFGTQQGSLISYEQAKKHISLFVDNINGSINNDEYPFFKKASVLGLIIAKYNDIPFLKKYLTPLFNDNSDGVREALFLNLILYTGIENWRKELTEQLDKETNARLKKNIERWLSEDNATQKLRMIRKKLRPQQVFPPLPKTELKPATNPNP